MKQSENNEIDILLRGFAQRRRAAADAQSVPQSAKADLPAGTSIHLDADELSAYAENALPLATRARYTAHLVDCDDCRKIVSQLSIATGLPAEVRVGHETLVSKWSEKLAALLSPRMLRYALPALVLFAVIAVGFFVSRQQKEASLVAQNGSVENSRVAEKQVESKQLATSPAQSGPKTAGNEEQAGDQKHSKPQPETRSRTTEKAAASAGAAASPTAAPAKDKESSKNEPVAVARPSYAPEPPPPSAKPTTETAKAENAAKTADESREKEEAAARKKEADKTGGFAIASAKDAPASPQTRSAQAPARKAKAAPSNARLMGGVAGARTDDQAEIRTIAGRRFRRQNGAWVDTAYDSSQSTTNVARGSDQYRALIADEPDIRTIAEQLSGQVIVVWKGRAYRIH